ncbi:hypothetical protein PCASD_00617 [Puccinia coronata f. sp. avenae]|uniref:Uncharacterized protein n=1 Tax=Puccinia coronata f. sp. avenae TaxID=200324 RepID=A0A2N5VNN6_9BASI|nr:hypothetical protein PCASD_00617 [Puccinia coronata f. sp. avenae]
MLSRGAVAPVHTPVDTTSAKGCVAGVAGNVTLPVGHVILDPGNVISATAKVTLPALTGRTRVFDQSSNTRVRPVIGQTLSDRSAHQLVGQACPTSA